MIIGDLHVHGRYSRATSGQLDLENLEKWARIKGVNLLGTGDFTHPSWLKLLKIELKEEEGILKSKNGFNFILQSEISLIYTQNNKVRKVHNILLAPGFEVVDQIVNVLGKKGRLDYDGRPVFGFSCIELVEMMRGISEDIEVIPAHCWTPWFSIFGSNSGFDSVKEAFQEKTKYIHCLETGLSSDPAMNWRLKQLDDYNLVSFSDLHSFWPWRIGREATLFDLKKLSYKNLINALRDKDGLSGTVEVDPNYGKYHYDGHRFCGVSLSPQESLERNNICPKCGKKLTIGVLHRIEELADREDGFKPKNSLNFKTLIPLSEVISKFLNSGISTKKVWEIYNKLIEEFDNEFNILLNVSESDLRKSVDEKLVDVILRNRNGELRIIPGFDGEYGVLVLDKEINKQKKLGEF